MTTVAMHSFAPDQRGHFRATTLAVTVCLLWSALLCTVAVQYRLELTDAEFQTAFNSQ